MTRHLHRGVATVWMVVVTAVAGFAPRPPVDNSVAALLASDAPEVAVYREFQRLFGSDEVVVARVEGATAWARFQVIEAVTATLTADPAIDGVLSVTALHPESTTVILDEVFGGPESLDERAAELSSPLVETLGLWSLETQAANVYGLAQVSPPEARAQLADRLEQIRRDAEDAGMRFRFGGPPFLNLALDQAGRRTEAFALPLLLAVTILLLLLYTASVRVTAALILSVGLTVLAVDSGFGGLGGVTNLLVNIAKPLLFVVGLASALHVYTETTRLVSAGTPTTDAPWQASRHKALPVTLALLTTAVGFGSLGSSALAPIRSFGEVSGVGLLVMIPTVLLLTPLGLTLALGKLSAGAAAYRPSRGERAMNEAAQWLVESSLRRPLLGPAIGVAVVVAGGAAVTTVTTEPHAIRYFEADHPLRRDHAAMEAADMGIATVEAVVTRRGLARDPDAVAILTRFSDYASQAPGVAAVVGWPRLVEEGRVRTGRPAVDAWLIDRVRTQPAARTFWADDAVRITFLIGTLDAAQLDALKAHLRAAALAHLPKDWTLELTGNYDLLLQTQANLLKTLTTSLVWTAVLMQLILLVALRSFWLGIAATLPNAVPVAFGFLAMAGLGIPLDLGTSMTAAIALGIAVDDTLHFTFSAVRSPLPVAARFTGAAILVSSAVIGTGFLALVTADFLPTRRFGGLCGLAMVNALMADLVILPPLIAAWKSFGSRRMR